jgi:sulfatase modifying factor 1
MKRPFLLPLLLLASPLVAASCSLPDLPVPVDGGDAEVSDAGAEGAFASEGGKDSASGEGGNDSGPDATFEAGGDASEDTGGGDSGKDATMGDGGPGDAGQDPCTPTGIGAVGTLGCVCPTAGQLACNGNAQPVTLICNGGAWTENQTCTAGSLCDSRSGATQGTCQPIDPACASASPGQDGCSNATTIVQCGADLVTDSPVSTCSGSSPACLSGTCVACSPEATQCSGNGVETCGTNGQWGSAVPCSATTPFCANGACTATPPSCQASGNGLTNCGASSESCCTSPEVAGGAYDRTYTNSGSGATGLADPATVSGFRLDKYLVTVGRFRQFVTAWNGGAGYTPLMGSGKHAHLNGGLGLANSGSAGTYEPGWVASDNSNVAPTNANLACDPIYGTWTTSAGSNENLPMNCVSWWESYAFCIWDGGFLPSEAEWEYAAAGGSQQREYPWGATAPGATNSYAIYGCEYPSSSGTCTSVTNIAPVGTATLGAGFWSQLDLAGEVFEWNLDWRATYVACTDCAYLTPAPVRVVRGGDFNDVLDLPPTRINTSPTGRGSGLGFRCARTP